MMAALTPARMGVAMAAPTAARMGVATAALPVLLLLSFLRVLTFVPHGVMVE
jgi:hypothetical protein